MSNGRHYYRDTLVNHANWLSDTITANFKDKEEPTLDLGTIEFKGEAGKRIIDDLAVNGYFEGAPYRYEVGEQATAKSIEFYLDFTDNPMVKACDIIEVAIKRKQGKEWIDDVADTAIYRYMASDEYNGAGKITANDYFGVPYIINYVPDGMQLLILALSTFSLTKALIDNIKSIAEQTADLSTNAIPTIGTGVGLGVVAVTAWPTGKIIASIIKLAVTVAETIAIVFGIIELVKQIVEQLAPKKRFHLGMPLRTLFKKGCDFLNLNLKSTLLDGLDADSEKWVVIPQKTHMGGLPPMGTPANEFTEVGFPTSADGFDTFGDVLRVFKQVFNADYRVNNGILEFERRDFWKGKSNYVIPNTFTNQEAARNETTVNSNEIVSNYVIKWATDQEDKNTLANPSGRVAQIVTSPNTVTNPELVNLKGVKEISIPLSMATRKNELTEIEKSLKLFLSAADFLTGQLGKPQGFASKFSKRMGSMNLSSHLTTAPKMVIMSNDSLATDQRGKLSALELWNKYHYIESFVTIDGENAQKAIYSEQPIDFCFDNFVSLLNNQYCTNENGEDCEIESINWGVESNQAVISYRVDRVYDTNLKINILTR